MEIECPQCRKTYHIPEERVSKFGGHVTFPCPACKGKIIINIKDHPQEKPKRRLPHVETPKDLPAGPALEKMILRTVKDLPPMPQVAHKARQVTENERSSFQDLAVVIETDQAIAAWREAARYDESFAAPHGLIGVALAETGDIGGALNELEIADRLGWPEAKQIIQLIRHEQAAARTPD